MGGAECLGRKFAAISTAADMIQMMYCVTSANVTGCRLTNTRRLIRLPPNQTAEMWGY